MQRVYSWVLLAALVLGAVIHDARTVRADSPITVTEQTVQSKFRQSLTFHIRATSTAGNITKARLVWQGRGHGFRLVQNADPFTPAREVSIQYTWDTSGATTPPWQVLSYRWEITDDAGNTLTTPVAQAEVSDDTRDWQKLSDGKVAVFWYDQDQDFGRQLLEVAQKGFDHVYRATGHKPARELRVILYNNQDDFCSFFAPHQCKDWVAGETFGGLTAEWLGDNVNYVMDQVVPHELAHAFLQDWLGPRIEAVPRWFDEGQAVNNQLAGIDEEISRARSLAQANQLERIANMESFTTIGQDNLDKTAGWYAQATSLVAYLYERYGLDSLGKIVTKINDGKRFEDAFTAVTGTSLDEFELGWRQWLGATAPPPTIAPTPTFNPFPPSPTYEPAGGAPSH